MIELKHKVKNYIASHPLPYGRGLPSNKVKPVYYFTAKKS